MKQQAMGWNFDTTYTSLPKYFFSNATPRSSKEVKLQLFNEKLAVDLGLDVALCQSEEGVAFFSGNKLPDNIQPIAQAYAGHQFGYFNMLGDGRAMLLGEHVKENNERYDIQLKGAGRTLYSRSGDGRAALGPMLREYLISEAMFYLGVPTARSLAVVTTGDDIFRRGYEQGAILTRVASSHLRVGTFQFAASQGNKEDIKALADYAINRHYPDVLEANNKYAALLEEVVKNQAKLIAKWQTIGFIHGVMNTDNVTISGETIDYGPCAFMDTYASNRVFSSIDHQGRYAYHNQPSIGGWNCARFAETLLPILDENEEVALDIANQAIKVYGETFEATWIEGMRAKLGLRDVEESDIELIQELFALMENYQADFTNTFRALTSGNLNETTLFGKDSFIKWYEKWTQRLLQQEGGKSAAKAMMERSNPTIIPRNHLVESAIASAEEGNMQPAMELLEAIQNPFSSDEKYALIRKSSAHDTNYQTFCGT